MTPPVPAHVAHASARALALSFLQRCGYALVSQTMGEATGSVHVTPEIAGQTGQLNGTELYGLLDCTAWFAVASLLSAEEAAVTHDAHFSILSAAPSGSTVTFTAKVEKRGRTTAFVEERATVETKTVALATITKSIIPLDVRTRFSPPSA